MIRHLSLLLLASTALLPAQDDRDRTTKTGAIWAHDQTTTDLTSLVNAGWRLTDIEIESTAPFEFTVSAVQNSGAYAKAWWYAIGVTTAQLSTTINQNNARIVDIETYDDNGTIRHAAILIANTGTDAKTWWWYTGQTSTGINSTLSANNGRLVCFDRYQTGGVDRWTTVQIANTGADQRVWGYLFGASAATIATNLTQNGNRIYGIERVGSNSYDVILMQANVTGWWYAFDQTAAQVTELLQQVVGRLVDVERHFTLSGTRYNVVVLDNTNALERTARQAFYGAATGALGDAYGFFLKEVDGPVLAEMRADTTFEPASTMKTLYHVHAMRRVHLGLATLNMQINKPLSCGTAGSNQTLSLTLREMMENSDNMSTLAVSNHFGLANIDATAGALGMGSTSVNFTIGCQGPTPESTLTLRDLTTLHEAVANGYLGSLRPTFYDLMAESLSFPSWGTEDLGTRINAEAVTLGLPPAVRDAFKNALQIAYKPGGIAWNTGTQHYYFAEGGWMSVPFKNASGALVPREYTFGVFNYDFAVQEVSGRNAMSQAELELVWNRVKAAMATWDNYAPGQISTLLGAGCAGSNGTPTHAATGTPDVGGSVSYNLANAPANALCLAMFGFGNQAWNGAPLPLNLAVVGAPNCLLRIDAVILEPGFASAGGTRSHPLSFANNPALVGARLYSQYLVYDPPANAFDWIITNAVRTTLGGWQ